MLVLMCKWHHILTSVWYGGGLNGGDSLKQYTDTYGASLSMGYWLNQNFKYSALYNFGYER